jgi:DNA-damage-inducible protein J
MNKTSEIRVRTESKLKREVENIFKKEGVSTTETINLFYKEVKVKKRLPFEIIKPNKTTKNTFKKTDKGKDLVRFDRIEDLLKDLKS